MNIISILKNEIYKKECKENKMMEQMIQQEDRVKKFKKWKIKKYTNY